MNRREHSLDASAHPAAPPFPAPTTLTSSSDLKTRSGQPLPASGFVTVSYAERKVVFDEPQCARAIYQVQTGAVLLSRASTDGRRQLLEILGPGKIFGVVAGPEYDCRAETLTRTTLRRIDRSAAERSMSTQKLVTGQLVQKLADFHDHTATLGRRSAAQRIAALLISLPPLELPAGQAAWEALGADQRVSLTQTDMANLLGLAMETVCRVVGDLRRRGVVSMPRRGRMNILDIAALRELAGE